PPASHHPPPARRATGTAPPHCERSPTRPSARRSRRTDSAPARRATAPAGRFPRRPSRDRRSRPHARAWPPASPPALLELRERRGEIVEQFLGHAATHEQFLLLSQDGASPAPPRCDDLEDPLRRLGPGLPLDRRAGVLQQLS